MENDFEDGQVSRDSLQDSHWDYSIEEVRPTTHDRFPSSFPFAYGSSTLPFSNY